MEGGSISLLKIIMNDPFWENNFTWKSIRLSLDNDEAFLERAEKRVTDMIAPAEDKNTLLDELVENWADPSVRSILADVDGYRYAISFAKENTINVEDMVGINDSLKLQLIKGISNEYLSHAKWQERDFPTIPVSWIMENGESPFGNS